MAPERRRRQEADDRLGDVRQVRGDAVAAPDAQALQARPAARDGVAQLRRGELDGFARLRSRDDHDVVRRTTGQPERVLGVVDQRVREPAGAGHPRDRRGRGRAVVADRTPKWSQTDCQNAPGSSTDQRQASS